MQTVDQIMEQAQVFASTYSLAGSRFDDGSKMQQSNEERALLREMLETAISMTIDGVAGGAVGDVLAERTRQVTKEGWTLEHDDMHVDGSMALAAGSYCESAARPTILARKAGMAFALPKLWPQSWSRDWWKPKSPRKDLVRAAALIIAEIERLDRSTAINNASKIGDVR